MAKKAAKKVTKTATKVAKAKKAPTAKTVAKKTAKKTAKKKSAKKKSAKKKPTEKELIQKHVAQLLKNGKPTERDEATKAAKAQLYDALHAVVRVAPSLSEAKEIIEKEVKEIRRALLEEWYRDNPEDLIQDYNVDEDIDIEDEDQVANAAFEYVTGLDDEEVDEWLEENF